MHEAEHLARLTRLDGPKEVVLEVGALPVEEEHAAADPHDHDEHHDPDDQQHLSHAISLPSRLVRPVADRVYLHHRRWGMGAALPVGTDGTTWIMEENERGLGIARRDP